MPKGIGYEHWHQGAMDTPADYAITYHGDNPAKGTHPYPGSTAHGKSSVKNAATIATKNKGGAPVEHGK